MFEYKVLTANLMKTAKAEMVMILEPAVPDA